jgi:hypothetical protein
LDFMFYLFIYFLFYYCLRFSFWTCFGTILLGFAL